MRRPMRVAPWVLVFVTGCGGGSLATPPPGVVWVDPMSHGSVQSGDIMLRAQVSENAVTGGLEVDGDALDDLSDGVLEAVWPTDDADFGSHTARAWVQDALGRTVDSERIVAVDRSPIAEIDLSDGAVLAGKPYVVIDVDDDGESAEASLFADDEYVNTDTAETYQVRLDTCAMKGGDHVLSTVVEDEAGHEAVDEVDIVVKQSLDVDIAGLPATAPETVDVVADIEWDVWGEVTFEVDGVEVYATRDRGADTCSGTCPGRCSTITWTWDTTELADGKHSVRVRLTEGSRSATDSANVTVDADLDDDGHRKVTFGGDDCDDADATVHPGLTEMCDGRDEDCSGLADDPFDADRDGYPSDASCGGKASPEDCDDQEPDVNPGAVEVCGDGVDQACNGTRDCRWQGVANIGSRPRLPGSGGGVPNMAWIPDATGDGMPDLLFGMSSNGPNGSVSLQRWTGSAFTEVTRFTSSNEWYFGDDVAAVNDLNGDSRSEIAILRRPTAGESVLVYRSPFVSSMDSSSAWARLMVPTTAYDFGSGDIDGDGDTDIVVSTGAGTADGLHVFRGPFVAGTNVEGTYVDLTDLQNRAQVYPSGDIDGDGVDDLVMVAYTDTTRAIYAYTAIGTGTVDRASADVVIGPATYPPTYFNGIGDLQVDADLNDDGYIDVVGSDVIDHDLRVYFGPQGTSRAAASADAILAMPASAPGSLFDSRLGGSLDGDGDGNIDLLVGMYRDTRFGTDCGYNNTYGCGAAYLEYGPFAGTGTVGAGAVFTSNSDLDGMAVRALGDLDGDGADDFVLGARYDSFVVMGKPGL